MGEMAAGMADAITDPVFPGCAGVARVTAMGETRAIAIGFCGTETADTTTAEADMAFPSRSGIDTTRVTTAGEAATTAVGFTDGETGGSTTAATDTTLTGAKTARATTM